MIGGGQMRAGRKLGEELSERDERWLVTDAKGLMTLKAYGQILRP